MVRLKASTGIPIIDMSIKFQFHNGSIKGIQNICLCSFICCFNSTMVRLKVVKAREIINQYNSFNSTMVRLKANNASFTYPFVLFQFHNGSIKGSHAEVSFPPLNGFNSTMVRLKELAKLWKWIISTVSIPQWFD